MYLMLFPVLLLKSLQRKLEIRSSSWYILSKYRPKIKALVASFLAKLCFRRATFIYSTAVSAICGFHFLLTNYIFPWKVILFWFWMCTTVSQLEWTNQLWIYKVELAHYHSNNHTAFFFNFKETVSLHISSKMSNNPKHKAFSCILVYDLNYYDRFYKCFVINHHIFSILKLHLFSVFSFEFHVGLAHKSEARKNWSSYILV